MIRLLAVFALVLALGLGAAWLADQPGGLQLTVGDLVIEMQWPIAALALVVLAVLAVLVWRSYQWVVEAPALIGERLRARGRRHGMEALSRGLIAAAAGDGTGAGRQALIAERQIGQGPLTLLLKAQAAQIQGDEAAARTVFTEMLETPETEPLGLRGLFMMARRAGDIAEARALAERAARLKPDMPWAALALFELQSAQGDWPAARATLAERRRHRLIAPAAADRQRAVLLTAEAQAGEETGAATALELALEAHKLAPDLVPAAAIAARILVSRDEPRRAGRVVEKTWDLAPHPDLAEVYGRLKPGDGAGERLKRMQQLAARGGGAEAALALARAALEARQLDQAREALAPHATAAARRGVCVLMAEIAAASGDQGQVREWLARAVGAPRDPAWVAEGHVSQVWRPLSPTGELDGFAWQVPPESVGPAQGGALEGRLAAMAVLSPPAAKARAAPPAAAARAAAPAAEARRQTARAVPLPPVPDDPGVADDGEDAEAARDATKD